jgi:ABC-type antimicrobial peptide transport system ATPase subunit
MRKITEESVDAFMNARKFKKANMEIEVLPNVTVMKLHGNPIAFRYNDPERTLSITDAGWSSNTTKEMLNGIPNVSIQQKNWEWFLNGDKWDGDMIDVS